MLAKEREHFKRRVLALDGRCLIHDDPADCEGDLQAHHVIYQKHLIRAGLAHLLWAPSNGMTVCYRAHRRQHNYIEPIPISRIPDRCIVFAFDVGLDYLIDRHYEGILNDLEARSR